MSGAGYTPADREASINCRNAWDRNSDDAHRIIADYRKSMMRNLYDALKAILDDCGETGVDGYVENSLYYTEVAAARQALALARPSMEGEG